MEAHINMGLGIINHREETDGIVVATSDCIHDYYWNFAYTNGFNELTADQIALAKKILIQRSRTPALWIPNSASIPAGWIVKSSEAWMWLDKKSWETQNHQSRTSEQLKIISSDSTTPDMLSVFEDAYSSDQKPGDIGYYQLPKEYGQAYMMLQPQAPARMQHFAGYIDDTCVAIASAVIWKNFGGIYSVATGHASRRKGYGRALSKAATVWLKDQNIDGILLQTEANSAVENMYTQLGFQRLFIGCICTE